ncbi:MAG: BspA family leucine-rich repeat surface protein [Oscillibacter sp.]|nr:BspA family leucine-rich repeat surface protein [Oscillibacter sp.]
MKHGKPFALSLIAAAFLLLFPLLLTACGGAQQTPATDTSPAPVESADDTPDAPAPSGGTLMEDVPYITPLSERPPVSNIEDYSPPVFGSQTLKRYQILSVTFLSDTSEATDESWDVSQEQDGSVLAWVVENGAFGRFTTYDLYIASDGGVIAPENCQGMFQKYVELKSVEFNSAFDTSNATNMNAMFNECVNLTTLDFSGFNTSNVTNMDAMFSNCKNLGALDVSCFNTSNVTDMSHMFSGCTSLKSLNISNFDTSNVTDMFGMFSDCNGLTTLDVSNFDTSKVELMSIMFLNCHALTSLDVSGFDTSSVTGMYEMFYGCSSLTKLDVSGFDTSNVTTIFYIFQNCPAVTEADISGWDLSNAEDADLIFG